MKQSFWDLTASERLCERLASLLALRGLAVAIRTGRAEPTMHITREGTARSVGVDPAGGGFACAMRDEAGRIAERRSYRGVESAARGIARWLGAPVRGRS